MSRTRAASESTSVSDSSVCHMMGLSGDGNDPVLWVVRAVLIVYAAFVASNLPGNVAKLFDNTVVRLVMVVLILVLAVCDPASAILLTIGFVLSIQTANKMHISKLANTASSSAQPETFMARMMDHLPAGQQDNVDVDVAVDESQQQEVVDVNVDVQQRPAQPPQQQQSLFTTSSQFNTVQTNMVQDNQATEVRTWQNEMGPQGLSDPAGFAFSSSGCSPAPVQL